MIRRINNYHINNYHINCYDQGVRAATTSHETGVFLDREERLTENIKQHLLLLGGLPPPPEPPKDLLTGNDKVLIFY